MRADTRDKREAEIAEAAYALMAEKGFQGLSMLAIAKRAKASNETLYRWYGDKVGLFRALIARNAALVSEALKTELAQGKAPEAVLEDLGPRLLEMVLSPRAIALNRAAAADATNALGAELAQAGRGAVFPHIAEVFARLGKGEADAALWVDVLVGDLQIRCATGAIAPPSHEQITARAERARRVVFGA